MYSQHPGRLKGQWRPQPSRLLQQWPLCQLLSPFCSYQQQQTFPKQNKKTAKMNSPQLTTFIANIYWENKRNIQYVPWTLLSEQMVTPLKLKKVSITYYIQFKLSEKVNKEIILKNLRKKERTKERKKLKQWVSINEYICVLGSCLFLWTPFGLVTREIILDEPILSLCLFLCNPFGLVLRESTVFETDFFFKES